MNYKTDMNQLSERIQRYKKMKTTKPIKRHGEQEKNNKHLIRDSEKNIGNIGKNIGNIMAEYFPKGQKS